jgi:NADH-quinone oxidoreductase subunit J
MTLIQIIFLVTAAVMILAAVCVVTVRKMLHAALWLVLTLFCVAVFFILLEAPFFGVVQVVVYIGAIAILMVFAVMLTRRMMFDDSTPFSRQAIIGAIIALALFGAIVFGLSRWPGFSLTSLPLPEDFDPIKLMGVSLVSPDQFLIPFEVASILLLAALIGAIYVGREKQS